MDLRSPSAGVMAAADEYADRMRAAATAERERRAFDARQLYLAAAKVKPGDAAALEGAARAAFLVKDNSGAIEHLRAALKANPDRDSIRERLASALFNAGELAAAEDEVQRLLGKRPSDVNLLNLLGVLQKRRGRIADAVATFRSGTELEPSNHSPWYNLGNTLLGQ